MVMKGIKGEGAFWRQISTGAKSGPRSLVCACLTLRLDPHQHQRNFFAACVWGEGQKKFLQFQAILRTFRFLKKR